MYKICKLTRLYKYSIQYSEKLFEAINIYLRTSTTGKVCIADVPETTTKLYIIKSFCKRTKSLQQVPESTY